MAPQLKFASLCFAAFSLLVLGASAELTIKAVVPFVGKVPAVSTVPGLAGFKDRFKQAWQGSLTYINDITGAGLGPAPSIQDIVPDWSYTETTATAIFPYTEDYLGPILYLIAAPTTFYYYNNDTNVAGYKLINIYKADVEGTTFDIVTSPTPVESSPPSPPPPIFPRPPSPSPPSPSLNGTVTFRVNSTVVSSDVPSINDTANFTAFEKTFLLSFSTILNCLAGGANTTLNGTTNNTLIYETCFTNKTVNSTAFPPAASINATQEFVDEPTATRRLLARKTKTTLVVVYIAVPATFVEIYVGNQALVVKGQIALIVIILVYKDLVLIQAVIIIIGSNIVVTPTVPGYGTESTSTGRRRMIERASARLASYGDASAVNWAVAEPSDVAYGTDKSLYEIFSTPADYFTAGGACAARGAKLASYSSEGSQIFIDILCDGAAGMQCWVEGNSKGACSAVGASNIHPMACKTHMPFVCVKDKSAKSISTAAVASNTESFEALVAQKPTDVAFDINKNLYEIFSTPVDFFTAGSVCLARGGELANYSNDAAQVIVDVLCEADASQTCWVDGNQAGKCSSLKSSDIHQGACTKKHAFVCAKHSAKAL